MWAFVIKSVVTWLTSGWEGTEAEVWGSYGTDCKVGVATFVLGEQTATFVLGEQEQATFVLGEQYIDDEVE